MSRIVLLCTVLALPVLGCSGGEFGVAASGDDASTSDDTSTDATSGGTSDGTSDSTSDSTSEELLRYVGYAAMKSRTMTVAIAILVVLTFATIVVASTMSGGDTSGNHTMQNGSTMSDDQMP